MKNKIVMLTLTVIVISTLLCGCVGSSQSNQKQQEELEQTNNLEEDDEESLYPYDYTSLTIFDIQNYMKYLPVMKISSVLDEGSSDTFTLDAVDGYTVMQGGCTDGKYMYLILENQNYEENGVKGLRNLLFKVDMSTWEIVKQSESLELDHGNGMTYNSKTNQLIVVHNKNRTNDISFVDPDTLEITGYKTLSRGLNGITYNAARDCYVIGISGKYDFAILNSDFEEISYHKGSETGLGNQSIDCDNNYIYVGNTGHGTEYSGMEVVRVYDWDGNFVAACRIDSFSEHEALINYNGDYWVTFYTGSGGRVYRLEYDFDLMTNWPQKEEK